jgi:16S rRNA (adenine1518-N6/adenine1519-N6)-dimethyltransferase
MSWNFAYDSPSAIKLVLEAQDMAMCKKFGQNFLISSPVREKIIRALSVEPGMKVWEIGPGIGSLTSLLLSAGAEVTAFEIDHGFCRVLRDFAFKDEAHFTLVEGDALKTMGERSDIPQRICGNLPYNVGTVVLVKILESFRRPQKMVFTLQKEVVSRITATKRGKDWSFLSILCQMDYACTPIFDIKKGCFYPEPNVTSSVVLFEKREKPLVSAGERDDFLLIVRDLFAQRRKTVKNNLKSGKCGGLLLKDGVDRMLSESGVSPSSRAEELDWDELLALTSAFSSLKATSPSDKTEG